MKKRNLVGIAVAGLLALAIPLSACGNGATELSYSTGINADGLYDNELFYRNDLVFQDAPDPGAIYEDGWFYTVTTGAPFKCYRTQNFANWEYMGFAFTPAEDAWSYGNYWAPEIIKSKADGKFYLYYSAGAREFPVGANDAEMNERMRIGVAVSDNVYGPYRECRDSEQKTVSFDIARSDKGLELIGNASAKIFAAIDAHPFYDGDELYMYFVKHTDRNKSGNSLWGMKMKSMTEPDYSTLTKLAEPRYATLGGAIINTEDENSVNEAPWMTKHTSVNARGEEVTKYYLTFSIYGYTDRRYSVCTAVSDSPLGEFTKLDGSHGQPFHGIDLDFDHMSGTGHHSLVEADGETFIIYHAHTDREHGSNQRAIAVDRVSWVYDEELGYDILHSNGPTYSLQPVPAGASGYRNLAGEATVTATNAEAGFSTELLNDGLIAVHSYDNDKEFRVGAKGTEITLEFAKEKSVRAVMVYNSRDNWLAFAKIDSVAFDGSDGKFVIKNLAFPEAYYWEDLSQMRPGGAAIAEFKEIKVKKITFKISEKLKKDVSDADYAGIAISEIAVLGK